MEPKLLDELADIIVLPKPQALAQLQEKKHQGKLSSGDLELLITEFLSPTRTESDGHKVALHTQLARARFADDDVTCCQGNGTPPTRYSWSVADRRSEPLRRGSPEWVAAKRPLAGSLARRSPLVTCLDDSDEDEEEAAPKIKWGRVERGRTSGQRCDARLRCARAQPSSLRSSWSVARDDDHAMVVSEGTEEAGNKRIEEPVDEVEDSANKIEEPVKLAEEPVYKIDEPVDRVGETTDKIKEAAEKIEKPVKPVQKPVDIFEEPRVMVADKSDRQHNNSNGDEEDREEPRSSWATTLGRWREATMWRC